MPTADDAPPRDRETVNRPIRERLMSDDVYEAGMQVRREVLGVPATAVA